MTRTGDMASHRPHSTGKGRGGRRWSAALLVLPLIFALLAPASALALAEYGETAPPPTTPAPATTSPTPPVPHEESKPHQEVKATKEAKPQNEAKPQQEVEPAAEEAPATSGCSSSSSSVSSSEGCEPVATTLPFTGLNLTWVVIAGAALLAGGLSLRLIARRQRS